MLKPIKSVSKIIIAASLMGAMVWTMPAYAAPAPAAAAPTANTATGVILDEFGDPMIGASVRVANNPAQGGATNIDGEFSIANVKPGTKLKITSVGYKDTEVVWQGQPIELAMELDSKMLGDVVVTAMGIKREEKTLTYAVQTIKNDEVTRIKETNFVNALQGKSAGLTITPNNSGAGGGASRIVLRGSTSILGSNQPLIVIDGVPMTNGMGSQMTDGIDMGGGKSGDDLLSTINPEDIENMTVLKGPNAAALYGSAANNGVIVITTKSGAQGTVNVNISSSTSIDRIALYPKQQQYYGISGPTTWAAWGPRVGTRTADDGAKYYGPFGGRHETRLALDAVCAALRLPTAWPLNTAAAAPAGGGPPPQDPAAVHGKGAAGHRTGARGAGAFFCPPAAQHRCRHPGGVLPHHGGHREKSGRDLKGEWIKCTCCLRCWSPFLPAWVPALAPALPA